MVCYYVMPLCGVTEAMMYVVLMEGFLLKAAHSLSKAGTSLPCSTVLPTHHSVVRVLYIVHRLVLHISPCSVYFQSNLSFNILCSCLPVLIPTARIRISYYTISLEDP